MKNLLMSLKFIILIIILSHIILFTTLSLVSCNYKNNIDFNTINNILPTSNSIKKYLKTKNYNIENFDVDIEPGMKTAIIRFMPDVNNKPFLTKKINLIWSTNDINKIITFTSLPLPVEFIPIIENEYNPKYKLTPESALNAINLLNGTNFSFSDIEIKINESNHNLMITPKLNGNFIGSTVEIINEPISLNQLFPLDNIGNVYIVKEVWDSYISSHNSTNLGILASVLEVAGDRNRFSGFYKTTLKFLISSCFLKNKIKLFIDEKKQEGTLKISANNYKNIINESTIIFKFKIITNPKKFLNFKSKKPNKDEEINVTLDKTYTKDTIDILRYDLVKKIIGQDFANKYKDILYDEIWLISFDNNKKEAILTPKPGSKLFAVSDQESQDYKLIPHYTLKVIFK
ncbi:hypothetical protein C6B38_01020 [Spiroplasma sp. ChiS]|uniref:hypothetical protein n=1 Tax=Spiroplasma sp. ChiS TaxID=2099885 RepID=UPI000CFA1997|nr:hypothetical protein [Spiroplasma sp. ChiS]PQP79491.1 hypothetical protein C6B38_01020 [Spiroplasma sp. ChiS]